MIPQMGDVSQPVALAWAFFRGPNVTAAMLDVMCIVGTVGGAVASGFIPRTESDPAS